MNKPVDRMNFIPTTQEEARQRGWDGNANRDIPYLPPASKLASHDSLCYILHSRFIVTR